MVEQGRLFHESPPAIEADTARGEPRLWVRRLIIWAKPGEIIREVRLRQGLNVVWSPDPGAPAAGFAQEGGSGHGAGKTLFCRLLRYCLGEDTFASDDLRKRIAAAFPEALVGAEVVVQGTSWGVVRPLGTTRRILAAEGQPEDLLEQEARGTGMKPLLDVISRNVLPDGIEEHMPGRHEWKSWLLALAWLTRDQECRFGHLLDWRHTLSDSRSPAAGLSKDDHLTAVRLLLGAITAQEISTQRDLESVGEKKRSLEQEASHLTFAANRTADMLATALRIDPSSLTAEELAAGAIQSKAEARLRDVEVRIAQDETDADDPGLRSQLEGVLQQLALVREQRERTQGLLDLQVEQAKYLRGERANIDAEEIMARLGPVCPVCNVPIDEALAMGCGLSRVLPDRDKIALDESRIAEQLGNCEQAISQYRHQLRTHDSMQRRLAAEEANLREQLRRAAERVSALHRQRRQEWLAAAKVAEDTRRLQETHGQLAEARRQIGSLEQQEKRLKEQLAVHRQAHADTLGRLQELFRYVCRELLGADTHAGLTLTGQGLRAEVQVGGAAMESLKAAAFDVAAMLMSIEGRTGVPAFLVHDSPREADLGLSHYHKLFRLMQRLESLGETPPFQYIVSTTTSPPEAALKNGAVVLQLQGSPPGERLLRRDL